MDDLLAFPVAHPTPNTLLPGIEAGVGMGRQTVLPQCFVLFFWIKSLLLQRVFC